MYEIIGFYPNWLSNDLYTRLNYDSFTTIAWAFLGANADGSLIKTNYPPASMIDYAHTYGKKVVVSLNPGWGSPVIDSLLANPTTLINNLRNEIQANRFDGIDIDIEGFTSTNSINGQSNRTLFTSFMQQLKTALPTYRVSVDLPPTDWNNVFDTNALKNYVDYFMIMGYDFHWNNGPTAGAVAPLSGVTSSIDNYLTTIPGNKLLLGVPYYGYEWQTSGSQPDAPTTGPGITITYADALTKIQTYTRQWNTTWSCPYYLTPMGQGWYDDAQSLALKYDVAIQRQLGGIGVWAFGYDTPHPELANLIINKFGVAGSGGGIRGIFDNPILVAGLGFLAFAIIMKL